MAENLYCPGNSRIGESFKDGWYRSFEGYPDMNLGIRQMLYDYAEKGRYESILLFFTEKAGIDPEYASFLCREVMRGYL